MSASREIEELLSAYRKALNEPSDENIIRMLAALLPFSPPGIEWGIEFSSLAGITYMLENGRVLAVKVSRDEFGPFMQTSIAPVKLEAIPTQALKSIQKDVGGFLERVRNHLTSWLRMAPAKHPKREAIRELIEALTNELK